VPFSARTAINADRVMSIVERIVQSNEKFGFDNDILIKVVIIELPFGGGMCSRVEESRTRLINFKKWFNHHCGHGGCFVRIGSIDLHEI